MNDQRLIQTLEAENRRLQQENAALREALSGGAPRSRRKGDRLKQAVFEAIYEQTRHLVGIVDLDGTLDHVNQAAQAFVGCDLAVCRGKPFWDTPWWTHSPEEQAKLQEGVRQAGAGEWVQFETTHCNAAGELRQLDFSLKPVRDEFGQVAYLLAEAQDVTEARQTAARLAQLDAVQHAILDAVQIGLGFFQNRVLQWCNPAFRETFGYTAAELTGMSSALLYADEAGYRRVGDEGYSRFATGAGYRTEVLMRKKSGQTFWCAASGQAVNPANLAEGSIWMLQDIDEQKRATSALERERQFTQAVLDSVPGLLYLYDDQGRLCRWNKQHETMTGYTAEELAQMTLMDWYRGEPEEAARVAAAVHRIPIAGHAEAEANLVTKDGRRVRYFFTAVSVIIDGRNYFVGIGIDVTERRRVEEALRAGEKRFKSLLQHSNDLIAIVDAAGILKEFIGAAEDLLGYQPEELIGANGFDFVHPEDLDSLTQVMAESMKQPGAPIRVEFRFRHRQGRWVTTETVGTNLLHDSAVQGIVLNIRDISERKKAEDEQGRLQEQLQQAMKMEAVGRLAGGVAHDFNNLLTTIFGNVELARMDLSPADPLLEYFDQIQKAADSAASLTRQLLAFSRRQIIEPKVLNLNDLIGNMHKMLSRLIGEDVTFQTRLDPSLGAVKVDPGQFEQVLVNLAVNARDAMPDGGRLQIETTDVELDEAYCAKHPQVRPGRFTQLAVSDTGHGMSSEVRQRVFEPFFTTKEQGRGTGLGLATTFGIVKQAEGAIEVYSEEGLGTTFKIYLPRVQASAEPLHLNSVAREPDRGTETVLLVEDDANVRNLARTLLRRLGYRVLPAANGGEALLLLEKQEAPIDLLMTDVVMPGMNGRELAERLLQIQPGMKVLFTSGYTEDVIVHHGIVEKSLDFLGKPYSMMALAKKVREILGTSP